MGKNGTHGGLSIGDRAEKIRSLIRTGPIIKKLQKHILAGHDEVEHHMTAAQVNAARLLLNKFVPDVAVIQIEVKGSGGHEWNKALEDARRFADTGIVQVIPVIEGEIIPNG